MNVYLDNGATTMIDPAVNKAMTPYLEQRYGNASSLHTKGREAREAVEKARGVIARAVGARENEIIFTSGGTESNNLALKGVAFAARDANKGNHIITTKIEHKCVLETCKWLETQGFTVTYLDVDKEGFVNLEQLEKAITPKTLLVSIIHGNNEVGTIQDLSAISKICKEKAAKVTKGRRILLHTDACQSFTKVPKAQLDVEKVGLDLVTLNAHKIHGPKGIGALYVRRGIALTPLQHGGGHEFRKRSGTENVPGIVGFAAAVNAATKSVNMKKLKEVAKLRDKLAEGLLQLPGVTLNGPPVGGTSKTGRGVGRAMRLCNNLNLSFQAVEGEAIGGLLDERGICTSTGSACSAHTLEPSYVLMAMGKTHAEANGSLRLTLSRYTTEAEIEYALREIPKAIARLRKISPFGKLVDTIAEGV